MTARILCLIILLLEIRGLSLSIADRKWMVLIFYTQLSNLVTTVSALLLLIIGQPYFVTVLRYLSTCMLIMTFLVTTCVLIPMGGDPKKLLWSGNGLYHHVLCPVISTASYILVENHASRSLIWLPAVLTLAYGMVMLYLKYTLDLPIRDGKRADRIVVDRTDSSCNPQVSGLRPITLFPVHSFTKYRTL